MAVWLQAIQIYELQTRGAEVPHTCSMQAHSLHDECMMQTKLFSIAVDPTQIVVSSNPESHEGMHEMHEEGEANNSKDSGRALYSFGLPDFHFAQQLGRGNRPGCIKQITSMPQTWLKTVLKTLLLLGQRRTD